MHYENGNEVARQLVSEVYKIAFSSDDVWKRLESQTEAYICHAAGMIALKCIGYFECSPEMMKSIIHDRQHEWDMHLRSMEILEDYDLDNQIKLLACQMPIASGVFYICVYTSIITIKDKPNTYHIVYQSIDHDRIPHDEPVVTVYPSGYFVSPIPGHPEKCQVTSIIQFPSEFPDNPKVIDSLVSSSDRVVSGLRGVVDRDKDNGAVWDNITNYMRKNLYHTMHDLDPANGWQLQVTKAGLATFSKPHSDGITRVATRAQLSVAARSHIVASLILTAQSRGSEWDAFVTTTHTPVHVRPNTRLQRVEFANLFNGMKIQAHCLSSIHAIKDNVCDMAYKLRKTDTPASAAGWAKNEVASAGGYIIFPDPVNSESSIVQFLIENRRTEESYEKEALRVLNYVSSLCTFLSKLRDEIDSSSNINENPIPRSPNFSYAQVMEEFSTIMPTQPFIDNKNKSINNNNLLVNRVQSNKRKFLMKVPDLVASNPVHQGTKAILFLVSDEAEAHRFVRRRMESPLVNSRLDLLPREIILEVFKFLDCSSLVAITRTCTHLKEMITSCNLWRTLFLNTWGDVRGRVARRYCGDDDPTLFFSSFNNWQELYLEKRYIESAWCSPETKALSFTVTKAHARGIKAMAMLPERHRLVTGSMDRLIRVWDVTSGACLQQFSAPSSCIAIQAWGERERGTETEGEREGRVKVAFKNGIVREYDMSNGDCLSEFTTPEPMRGCFFYDTRMISWYENASCFDQTTQQTVRSFTGHQQRIKQCALCPDKSILFTASRDTTVRLWDVHSQVKIATIQGHTRAVNAVAVVGGNLCLTGSSDKTVKAWDIRKIDTPIHTFTKHTGKLKCIQINEIGGKICTAGEDGVHLWNVNNFSHIRGDWKGEWVSSVAMDEECIAYGGENGQIQFYDFTPHR